MHQSLETPNTLSNLEKAKLLLVYTKDEIKKNNRIIPESKDLLNIFITNFLTVEGSERLDAKLKIIEMESLANKGDGMHNIDPIRLFAIGIIHAISNCINQTFITKGICELTNEEQSQERTLRDFHRELSDGLEKKLEELE